MKDDVKAQESSMTQKSAKRSSWENVQDIKLPKLLRIFFIYVKSFYQYIFIQTLYKAKNISSLFISRKLIASLKKTNNNNLTLSLDSIELTQLGVIL